MIAPETQRFMAQRAGGHVHAMQVDHTPLASAPDGVVAFIAEAADAVLHEAVQIRRESDGAHEDRLC
jgi:hypothetical protein